MLLTVSAPFHCALMQPAADAMAEALAETQIEATEGPARRQRRGGAVTDPAEIRGLLVEQVTGSVRWRESVANGRQRRDRFAKAGAGKVLTGMFKRIALRARHGVGTPADLEAYEKSVNLKPS